MSRHFLEAILRIRVPGPAVLGRLSLSFILSLIPVSFLNGGGVGASEAAGQASNYSEAIVVLEPLPNLVPGIVALGRRLFHDQRLSRNGEVACVTCHDVAEGGADTKARSVGVTGKPTLRNSPSVLNSGYSLAQFWDGRAASLEEQVDGPLRHPDEMGGNWHETLKLISQDREYRTAFQQFYEGSVTREAVENAIATYERSLVTTNAPIDRFLMGDKRAITSEQREGYRLFQSYGCVSCHQGRLVGGNLYQLLGVFESYFSSGGKQSEVDFGRYNVTGREEDRFVFKVPSLRNVALTAPYFHDGSVVSLEEAVRLMARFQLGRVLEGRETRALVAFLQSLTGDLPEVEPR